MNWKQALIAGVCGLAIAIAMAGWLLYPRIAPSPSRPFFADWGAVVVAGDWRASDGQPSEVFDNGRREIARKLVTLGFRPGNVLQYSVRPENYPGETVMPATAEAITGGLDRLGKTTPGGCLAYFTSHGEEGEGIIIGDRLVDPPPIAARITAACGERPTVVIVSACFAGQFIPALRGPRRIVLTAARADRSSFGCGEEDDYSFYDACLIQALDRASGFRELASVVEGCVTRREAELDMDPPSEPQAFFGAEVTDTLDWK